MADADEHESNGHAMLGQRLVTQHSLTLSSSRHVRSPCADSSSRYTFADTRTPLGSLSTVHNVDTASPASGDSSPTLTRKALSSSQRRLKDDLPQYLARMSLHEGNAAPSFAILEDSHSNKENGASPVSFVAPKGQLYAGDRSCDGSQNTSTSAQSEQEGDRNLTSSVSSVTSEQDILSVSAKVTDLLMAIQEISTVLFEVQELRHSATVNTQGSADGRGEEIDEMLGQLATKLDAVGILYGQVDTEVTRTLDAPADDPRGEIAFLRQKWADAASDWEGVQADAEQLTEELKEDKWLVVFRTVSQQADDMQQSLEKALSQCALFLSDTEPQLSTGRASLSDAKRQHLLATCSTLHRSLDAKVKYYSPACERVLTILGKGIADRTTKNGEALRRLGEMKTSWAAVQRRIDLVDADLTNLERSLSEVSVEASRTGQRRLSNIGGALSPPRQHVAPGDASPTRRQAETGRFLGLGPVPTIAPTLGTVSPPQSRSPKATPPRPPKSLKRFVSDSHASPSASADKHTPLVAITPRPVAHRRSLSALSASAGPTPRSVSQSRESRRQSLRPISPHPPAPLVADRPRWNSSLKPRETSETVAIPTPSRPRSGRSSAVGSTRPSSRTSFGSSVSRSIGPESARPASPCFSEASSAMGRERPGTPSRIPRPASAIRRRSSVFGSHDASLQDTLARAVSPTPRTAPRPSSSMAYSLSRSVGPGTLPSPSRPRIASNGARTPSRPVSPAMSNASSSNRARGTTPEPSLMAQAQRFAGPRLSSTTPRPPPVPRVPSSYRRESMSANGLMSPPRVPNAHPPSSAGHYALDRAMTPLPSRAAPSEYTPNTHDPLDIAVAEIANSMPVLLDVVRVDAPLTRAQAGQIELFQAKYSFGHPARAMDDSRKAVMCKLVDRVGARARKGEKKVLVRIGGGWQELEVYMLSLIANNC